MRILIFIIFIVIAIIAFSAVYYSSKGTKTMSGFKIIFPAFEHSGNIPAKYTCDGGNINPLLEISGAPEGAQSFALVMDDPDATGGRTWDHWLFWNLEPNTAIIEEGKEPEAVSGTTSFGNRKYGGP